MTPVIFRTKRDSVASSDPLARIRLLYSDPLLEDFLVYRHLAASFAEHVRCAALLDWSSVLLTAQSFGLRYAAWKNARIKAKPKLTRTTRERRNKLNAPADWPGTKLLAQNSVAPPALFRLALGQPNEEDYVDMLSRCGESTRALLLPLVLDFSAMGLRRQHITETDTLANGHGQWQRPAFRH
jgi:hypothetical protein